MSSLFDLTSQYNFYKKYHSNPINVFIHIICIPMIFWSISVLLAPIQIYNYIFNLTFFVSFCYSMYYHCLDLFLGQIMTILLMISWYSASIFYYNNEHSVKYAITINIVSWILQFIGHGLFEGKKPALIDNLIQAFLIAPMFVLIDVLSIFGYKLDESLTE